MRANPAHRCIFTYGGPVQIPSVGTVQQCKESTYLPAVDGMHTAPEKIAITTQILSLNLPVQRPLIRLWAFQSALSR